VDQEDQEDLEEPVDQAEVGVQAEVGDIEAPEAPEAPEVQGEAVDPADPAVGAAAVAAVLIGTANMYGVVEAEEVVLHTDQAGSVVVVMDLVAAPMARLVVRQQEAPPAGLVVRVDHLVAVELPELPRWVMAMELGQVEPDLLDLQAQQVLQGPRGP
jgi:hypothetical protein